MYQLSMFVIISMLSACTTASKDIQKKEDPSNSPALTKPVVRRLWIPDQILDNGKVFDQGHWRYLLETEPTWSK